MRFSLEEQKIARPRTNKRQKNGTRGGVAFLSRFLIASCNLVDASYSKNALSGCTYPHTTRARYRRRASVQTGRSTIPRVCCALFFFTVGSEPLLRNVQERSTRFRGYVFLVLSSSLFSSSRCRVMSYVFPTSGVHPGGAASCASRVRGRGFFDTCFCLFCRLLLGYVKWFHWTGASATLRSVSGLYDPAR